MMKTRLLVVLGLTFSMVAAACGGQPTQQPTPTTGAAETTPQILVVTATPEPTVAPGSIQINGAGATFPLPVYTEWTYAYQYVDPSVVINYQGIGSGGGKKGIIDRTIDFAGSDSLLKDEEYQSGGDLQMYPMLAGAVVPVYNVEGLAADDPMLILDRPTLVGIYDGTIVYWNDPAIVALNPDLASKLPHAPITVVHRSDGSGTTEIFTRALASFSQQWANAVGAGASVEWPVDRAGRGVGARGNQGVAAAVINTPDSIGYVELSYAVSNRMSFARMVNRTGDLVEANADSLASAMADFAGSFSDKLTAVIVDGPGAGSWPIAGYTYLILHTQTMENCVVAQKLLQYIRWTLTDPAAAQRAAQLGYSVLPAAVREMVLQKLGEVTCGGQLVMQTR